jgi:hypothetical protein
MTQAPYPAIHTAANARAEARDAEVASLRAHADELLAAIDDLCGEPVDPTSAPRGHRHAA